MTPRHTPYDGSSKLFAIGLRPVPLNEWFVVDNDLRRYLDEKDRLLGQTPSEVFAAEAGTETAQAEALSFILPALIEHHADIYALNGSAIDMASAFRRVRLDDFVPPLLTAAGLVEDDLVLMRRDERGWRVAAGCVCFPSSWRLPDKFGRVLHDVHAPVPEFGAGSRNASMIERIFDNLQPGAPVLRWNWSLYGTPTLHHPHNAPSPRFGTGEIAEDVFIRVERQTLMKLPQSGDILFAIRILIDPIDALRAEPDLARAVIAQLENLSSVQLDYKGIAGDKSRLIARLEQLAGG